MKSEESNSMMTVRTHEPCVPTRWWVRSFLLPFGGGRVGAAVIILFLLLFSLSATAQDVREYKGKVTIHNKENGKNIMERVYYGVFQDRAKAEEAERALRRIVESSKGHDDIMAGLDIEKNVKAFRERNGIVSRTSGNGEFSKMGIPGMTFLFVTLDGAEFYLQEVTDPNKYYEVVINVQRIDEIRKRGKKKLNDSIGGGITGDPDDGNEYFPVHFTLRGPGVANKSSRLIIQPFAVDCQTDDTVDYLKPLVYEGLEYHGLQDKRKGFDYFTNDSLSRGYKTGMVLDYEHDVEVDTVVVYPKAPKDKDKTFKGPFTFVIEDYHHVSRVGGWGGTCLRERPFKFLDFNVAVADMELTEEFHEPAESQFGNEDRKLDLFFKVGKDELEEDSLNEVTLSNLIKEMKTYGDKLVNVAVEGAASPDGPTAKNTDLARRRAQKALSIISSRLGRRVNIPAPTVKVYTWNDVADELEHKGLKAQAEEVRTIVEAHPGEDGPDAPIYKLTYYADTIGPILKKLRVMKCSYMFFREKVMNAEECVQFYYENKAQCLSGEKKLSDGDFYNLFATISDTTELDTITVMAYNKIIKGYNYQYESRIAPYVANRMALLRLREGTPDPAILDPFIDYSMRGVNADKYIDEMTTAKVNRADILLNQAIIYFQEQKMDSSMYLINKLKQNNLNSVSVEKVEKFMNLKRLHYLRDHRTAEQERLYQEAKDFVLGSSDENKAILYTEIKDWGMRDEAARWVDRMDDGNAKKWYLKALLAVDKAGNEESLYNSGGSSGVPVATDSTGQKLLTEDEEIALMTADPGAYNVYQTKKAGLQAMQEEINRKYAEEIARREAEDADMEGIPSYMAYFHHSFELQPSYKRLYFNEGHVTDELRKKYKYSIKKIPAYRKMFEILKSREEKKNAPAGQPEEENHGSNENNESNGNNGSDENNGSNESGETALLSPDSHSSHGSQDSHSSHKSLG